MPPVMALNCLVMALRGFLVIEVAYTERKRSNMLRVFLEGVNTERERSINTFFVWSLFSLYCSLKIRNSNKVGGGGVYYDPPEE